MDHPLPSPAGRWKEPTEGPASVTASSSCECSVPCNAGMGGLVHRASGMIRDLAQEHRVGGAAGGEERNLGALVTRRVKREDVAAGQVGDDAAGFEDDGGGGGDV